VKCFGQYPYAPSNAQGRQQEAKMGAGNLVWILALGSGAWLIGCGSDDGVNGAAGFREVYDQGLTRYVGAFAPSNEPTADEAGVKHWEFAVPDALSAEPRSPVCLRGGEWTVDTRAGASNELVIFLQGGGACWADFCAAFENAGPITVGGILDPELEGNPVADWDVVYLPYCDGSLFAGDVDRVLPASALGEPGPSVLSYQRGLQNLTSALDIAVAEFPNPDRILLTGVSAGAFGTIVSLPLVRFYYPNTEILVFNDSGVGVAKDGNPDFVNETFLAGWNADSMIPVSCPDCTSNGHVTRLIEWQLEADPNVTMSALSFSQDFVVATLFLMIPVADFTASLLAETGRIAGSYPDRYKRFITVGASHTAILVPDAEAAAGLLPTDIGHLEIEIGGTTVLDWFTALIDGTDAWENLVDPSLE